jgi:hypothetical protein
MPVRILIAAVALFCTSLPSAWAQSYTFTDITSPGSTDTYAFKINNAGQVAGYYLGTTASDGFLYYDRTILNVVFPGASETALMGLNNVGQIAGYFNGGNCTNADETCGFVKTSGDLVVTRLTLSLPAIFKWSSFRAQRPHIWKPSTTQVCL